MYAVTKSSGGMPGHFCVRGWNAGKNTIETENVSSDPRPGSRLWEDAQELAKYVLLRQEELPDITDGALHYHASYIDAPKWAKKQKITTKIDTHIFYR